MDDLVAAILLIWISVHNKQISNFVLFYFLDKFTYKWCGTNFFHMPLVMWIWPDVTQLFVLNYTNLCDGTACSFNLTGRYRYRLIYFSHPLS